MSGRAEWSEDALVEGVLAGNTSALARAISLVEDGDPLGRAVVRRVYPLTGTASVVGVTGPPGAGKSSLVSALVSHLRAKGLRVGIVSVDPSSTFTRGALLGDRIRLAEHFTDPGVFIRSMGTRGHAGGLAGATLQTVALVDASGVDVVLVETVGAGQSELEIARAADLVVLTLMPGAGDGIQALKAGIMEIPDVIAVTKSDQDGAAGALADVRTAVELEPDASRRPALVATSAVTGEGVAELWDAVLARRAALGESGELGRRRARNAEREVLTLATERFRHRLESAIREDAGMRALIDAVDRRELDPVSGAEQLSRRLAGEESG